MKNEEILKKAIEKAVANGWKKSSDYPLDIWKYNEFWYQIIFDHDFAKAFWGEEDMHEVDGNKLDECGDSTYYTLKVWQYHLQQMVLEEEPLKYLEKFL